jgi:metallo-beta-lactamase family protein
MQVGFFGGVGTVTGSKYLVEAGGAKLLVDCGLFQGVKALRERNWKPLPFDPGSLDAVVLTHAHIDHSGYLPALVRDGFRGKILCTPPTRALCGIMLPDSGHLHEEDARYANRKKFSKHEPALPLYTEEDALRSLDHFEDLPFGEEHSVGALRVRLSGAGHILGAASARVSDGRVRVLFSGDLGRRNDLLMPPPEPPGETDYVLVESTYGNRLHPRRDPIAEVAEVLERTTGRGGILLMPSFAVGRAQTLLYILHEIFRRDPSARVPVFVNSPMATDVTEVYERFVDYHSLSKEVCSAVCDVAHFVRSVEESKELAERRFPMVIISASGMATGGRVLHHLKQLAPDHRNTILLPGFQAPGTRGEALASGAQSLKIHGKYVPVEAEVEQLALLSAHADQEGLLQWLEGCAHPPRRVFVTHGEPAASDALRRLVKDRLGYPVEIPEYRDRVELA